MHERNRIRRGRTRRTRTGTGSARGRATQRLTAGGRAVAALAVLGTAALGLSGCGDGPICPSDVSVFIVTPDDGASVTGDVSSAPGVQIDVLVRSNLDEGDPVTLAILDGDGTEQESIAASADAAGDIAFAAVTVPDGAAQLRVTGVRGECGSGTDEVALSVLTGATQCVFEFREDLVASDFYDPVGVLNASSDSDPLAGDFQGTIEVVTGPGFAAELKVLDTFDNAQLSFDVVTADDGGEAAIPVTLDQGYQVIEVTCRRPDGAIAAEAVTRYVFVDTVVPTCDLVNPPADSAIIPELDIDGDPGNGIQVELTAQVSAGAVIDDIRGEVVEFAIDGMSIEGTAVDDSGQSVAVYSFDTPGTYTIEMTARDHAENLCQLSRDYDLVFDGCPPAVVLSPTATVTTDQNGDPSDGLQADLIVSVNTSCDAQTVSTDCGLTPVSVPADGSGSATMELTLCSGAICEATYDCTVTVTTADGIATDTATTIAVDNEPPNVALQFIDPPVMCGAAISTGADVDGDPANGVQIDVRVVAPLADLRSVEVTGPSGALPTVIADVGGNARISVELGANAIIAVGEDAAGNVGQTDPCQLSVIEVADIAISFAPPIGDGLVGPEDGAVGAGDLTLDLCGTVSESGASVELSIDGGAAEPATVTGTDWCLSAVTLSEGSHVIDASATLGLQSGSASLNLVVDLTAPTAPGGLFAFAPNRQAARLTWTASDNDGAPAAGYIIKRATVPLDDSNFDSTGTAVTPPPPGPPGAVESFVVNRLNAGTAYYLAIAAVDSAGNRSPVAATGPVTPDFDSSAAIPPPASPGIDGLGFDFAAGDYDGDGFGDLAVAAPLSDNGAISGAGAVYVYFGSPVGFTSASTPDVTIPGLEAAAQLGRGITAIEWGGGAADDLAVGAPFGAGADGRVFIFFGGAGFSSITGIGDADVVIGVDDSDPTNWFEFSGLGWSLTRARFDTDSADDLIIGAVNGGAGNGGVAVLFGGTAESNIQLSTIDATGSGTARTLVIEDLDPGVFDLFGDSVYNLGRTEGAGDPDDDLGVSYNDGGSAYVVRGRPKPASPGVTLSAINLSVDLEISNTIGPDNDTYFGTAMGSIADINGDGARDVIIGAWGQSTFDGQVFIVDGNAIGTQSVSSALVTINPVSPLRKFGSAIVNNAEAVGAPDVNGDGIEDLLIAGGSDGGGDTRLFVWFGGTLPTGSVSSLSADHVIVAPAQFEAPFPPSGGTPISAAWAGDLNQDGLEDLCWGDTFAQSSDGVFAVLWDDGN